MTVKTKNLSKNSVQLKNKPNEKKYIVYILLAIILITITAYSNSINNKFTNWDDKDYITDNNDIKDITVNNIKNFFSKGYVGMYQPVTMLAYSLEYNIFGSKPSVFHITNLILHLINIVLVFYLIFSLTGKVSSASFVSLFFAIHPMHVESVTWISELKDVLYSAFYLGSLLYYVYYLKNLKKQKFLIISLILFSFSLLSKSAAVTLPLLLILFDYYYNRKFNSKSILEKIPFLVLSIIFGIISIFTQKAIGQANEYTQVFNFFDKILLVCYNIGFYIFNLFFPFKLSAIHPFPSKVDGFLPWEYYISPLFIGLLIWGIIKFHKQLKNVLWGILFFFITIILVIQIIPIGRAVVAERYTYIPYIGLLFSLAQIYYFIKEKNSQLFKKISNYVIIITAIFAITFFSITIKQNKIWKDSITLWSNVLDYYPDVAFAYNGKGYAYFSELDDKNTAIINYTKAIEYNYNFTDAWYNRATAKLLLKDYKGALEDFNTTLKIDENYKEAYFNRGYTKYYGLQDNYGALDDFNKALKYIKNDPLLFYNLGNIKFALKDYKGSLDDFSNAIRYDNNYADAWYNRAGVKLFLEDYKGALEDYNMTINIDPNYKETFLYYNRGFAKYKGNKDYKGALEDFDKVLVYVKDNYIIYFNRGNVKFALKDYKGALEEYNISIKLYPDFAETYFNRANTEYFLNDSKNACKDWQKSSQLGYKEANIKLNKYCK